jgi:hypothetical protein
MRHRRPGGFLVRISENRFGYTLSYRVEDRCRHYIVEQDTRSHYALVGVAKVCSPHLHVVMILIMAVGVVVVLMVAVQFMHCATTRYRSATASTI